MDTYIGKVIYNWISADPTKAGPTLKSGVVVVPYSIKGDAPKVQLIFPLCKTLKTFNYSIASILPPVSKLDRNPPLLCMDS